MNETPTADDRRDPGSLHDAARDPRIVTEPEVDEVSALARHSDPSRSRPAASTSTERAHNGVVLVRPSELLSGVGGRMLGRSIDFQAELARRARALPVQAVATSRRAIRERALRMPPVPAFGHRGRPTPRPRAPGWI